MPNVTIDGAATDALTEVWLPLNHQPDRSVLSVASEPVEPIEPIEPFPSAPATQPLSAYIDDLLQRMHMKLFLHPLSSTWLACLDPNQIIALDTHQTDLSALIAINTGRAIWVQSHPHGRHALVSQAINHLSQRGEHDAVTFLEALTDDEISWLDSGSLFTAVQMGARRWLMERPSTLSVTHRTKVSRMIARIDDFPPCYREMCLDDKAAEYLSLVDESTIDRAPRTLNGLLVEIARGRKSWFLRRGESDPHTLKIKQRALGEDAFYLRVLSERVLDGIQCRNEKAPSRYPLSTAVAQARAIISARPERAPVLLNMCHNVPLAASDETIGDIAITAVNLVLS